VITKATITTTPKRLTHREKDILILELQATIQSQAKEISDLKQEVADLKDQIIKLLARLDQNSNNSSKPPSSDPPHLPKPPRYPTKIPSLKLSGGQHKHKGSTLSRFPESKVDKIIEITCYRPTTSGIKPGTILKSYQEVDIQFSSHVTEYRLIATNKTIVGNLSTLNTTLPNPKATNIIYSPNIQALVTYLTVEHAISEDRTKRIFNDLFGIPLSSGFVSAQAPKLQSLSQDLINSIQEKLIQQPALGVDETFVKLSGKTGYIWNTHSIDYSYFQASENRKAINIQWLLPYKGTLVHDRYSLYNQIQSNHQVCTVHIQRNLKALPTTVFRTTLEDILGQAQKATISPENHNLYTTKLQQLLQTTQETWDKATRAMYLAISKYQSHLFQFLTNPLIPHHNNGTESQLRKSKVKTKVSGCFRTLTGMTSYAIGLSIIQTCRKQGYSVLQALRQLYSGQNQTLKTNLGLV
jgi:transposase